MAFEKHYFHNSALVGETGRVSAVLPEAYLDVRYNARTQDDMTTTRQDIVAAYVRRAIMTGRLHPGDRLIEQALAAELRMSRGPVRDALRLLEQEGLVQIYRNRGAIVSMLGLRDAYEFYLVRGHLESLAVRLGRDHMQPADIDYLQSLVGKMADLGGAEGDWLVAADLDLAFHRRIVACSQNHSLIQTYGAMD